MGTPEHSPKGRAPLLNTAAKRMPSRLDTALGDYLKQIKKYALLTAEEERELALRIRAKSTAEAQFLAGRITLQEYERVQRDAAAARDRMIQANLRLVVAVAKNFRNRGLPMEDLVNEGNLGLVHAVDRYDPDVGSRFSTYAGYWIDQAIRRAVQNAGQMIHIPSYLMEQIGEMRLAQQELEERLDRPPTTAEICEQMAIRRARKELLARLHREPTSEEIAEHRQSPRFRRYTQRKAKAIAQAIQACRSRVQGSASPHGDVLLSDALEDTRTPAPFDAVFNQSDAEFVRRLLDRINEREALVLKLRYGLQEGRGKRMTLKEIGREVGLTRERVRQIEREAKQKLEQYMKEML